MYSHVRIQILLRFGRVAAKLAGKAPSRNMSISNVFSQTSWRFATHIAEGALIMEHVQPHVISQNSFGGIKLIAMRTPESLH